MQESSLKIKRLLLHHLAKVEMPGRYSGGEFGSIYKTDNNLLNVVVSYPDLYEIGMSNLAVKILYNSLNALPDVNCERVFAPAIDLEKVLREHHEYLFSLESKRPLKEFDMVCFSVGSELTFTNILNMLELGGIAIFKEERAEDEPIVLGGGPALTNPIPLGRYLDGVFIGEAEEAINIIFPVLARMKRAGANRQERLAYLNSFPAIWSREKLEPARRSIWSGFGLGSGDAHLPVANTHLVQDHGTVEIMRGCFNGCRFCHAGVYYRPSRMKEPQFIFDEVKKHVLEAGQREISLSSLSSGDYQGIEHLITGLNNAFKELHVSFSLPSLRIDTLGLNILQEISLIRKSGLTFAVETPTSRGQAILNKAVTQEKTINLLKEAKKNGWKSAKFYFMLGLPAFIEELQDESSLSEEALIINFLKEVYYSTKINININLAAFIPKPHTAFQWCRQLTEEEALAKIMYIKNSLKSEPIKVGYHSPFISVLEGVLSRGDDRVGELIYNAFKKGARFDAWMEYIDWDLWRNIFKEATWPVLEETLHEKDITVPLPWDRVDLGVSKEFLKTEYERARHAQFTPVCPEQCTACGVCDEKIELKSVKNNNYDFNLPLIKEPKQAVSLLIKYSKKDAAIFLSHLNVITIIERALLRAGYYAVFTVGFNPKPKLEFAHPLTLGFSSEEEVARLTLHNFDDGQLFIEKVNAKLPTGLSILQAKILQTKENKPKLPSLMALYWGSDYLIHFTDKESFSLFKTQVDLAGFKSKLWNVLQQYPVTLIEPQQPLTLDALLSDPAFLADESATIRLRLMQTPGKSAKLITLLTELCGAEPFGAGLAVTRLALWATGNITSETSKPVSYFEIF